MNTERNLLSLSRNFDKRKQNYAKRNSTSYYLYLNKKAQNNFKLNIRFGDIK